MNSKFVIIPALIIAVSVLAVLAIDSANLDKICAEEGGVRNGDVCLIEIVESLVAEESNFDLSNVKSMRPNSMEFFYYPYPEDTANRDAFQKFILIRLPEELGGGLDDVSAFRAYSALSVSNHCLIKYWPDDGRQRMEDPCWGSMYRPIDGLMIAGGKPVTNTAPVALPSLDLSIDENGSLYVEPPVWTLRENGVVGVGREISLEEIRKGSQVIVDSYRKTNPNHPDLSVDFAGYVVTQIYHHSNKVEASYQDFSSSDWRGISFYIRNVSAEDQKYFLNLAKHDSEYWQIGDTVIRIGGSGFDKTQPVGFENYTIEFALDGFMYLISGKNLEFMKKAIVTNYFPEFEYGDMFLVSSTVKK